MKRYVFAVLALTVLGISAAKADTQKLTTANGWTKITTLPSASDIANNYYVIVDNSQDLMLTISNGSHNKGKWYSLSLWYQTSVSPTTSAILSKLWILQKGSYGDGSYALQSVEYPARLLQTEKDKGYLMETNDVSSPNEWSQLNFAYSNGYWTIENGKYPSSSSAGYRGHLGPWDENNTNTNIQNGQELAGNKSGNFIGRFQIYAISRTLFKENYLAAASSTNPVDVSFIYVTNPTLDLNIDGWTRSATSLGGTAAGNYCTETWHSSTDFKFYQNVSSLTEGVYQVSVQARSQTNSGAVYATVGDNTVSTPVNTTTSSTSMQTEATTMLDRTTGKITTPSISLDLGKTLTMGFMDNVADHWDVFDNFKLYYLGNDLSDYAAARDAVKTTAENAIASNLVPNACEDAIQTAIDNNSGDYTTKAAYVAAQNAIQSALDTYFTNEIKDAYASFYAFKAKVVGLTTGQSASTELNTFNNAANTATNAVEAAITAAAITAQIPNLRSAGLTYISSVEGQFDITFLASQVYSDWKKTDGSAAGIVADQYLNNRPNTIPSFAENFEWTAATTGNVLYQTVSDLPVGYYHVGMYTMALSTSLRDTNIATEATEGDADRSFAFAGDLTDALSIQRTGMPIKFATAIDFDDLTILDVNVHLSQAGSLTFGVQKDKNGSNWHFAQIVNIIYSNAPDLTGLQETRDALVAEAQGLLAGADAAMLTQAQQQALQDAINDGVAADDFDELNDVTLTTLPNAINTAKQQIAQVKAAIPAMLAALERFESDYNLADGTDYCRVTMSTGAWTTLLAKVNAVSTALDDISQASTYAVKAQELVAQLDATDASLRLFKSYKAMVEGTTALSIVGDYGADANMADDAAEQAAITALNTAFDTYALSQTAIFNASAFLGENLDFNAAEGSQLGTVGNIYDMAGWEETYEDVTDWARLRNQNPDDDNKYAGQLYIRTNWTDKATVLTATKQKMLPVGKYQLSLDWSSDMQNMTNLSCYKLGNTTTAIGEDTSDAEGKTKILTYDFAVSEPTPFDLVIGFQKTGKDNAPAQIIVDDVTLTYIPTLIMLYDKGTDAANNATTISDNDGSRGVVTLSGRTLIKDNSWNTLCLPFDMTAEQVTAQLAPTELKELDKDNEYNGHKTGLDGTTLYLNFKDATTITAGKPYLIKWSSGTNVTDPVFRGVTVSDGLPVGIESEDKTVTFQGTYAPVGLAKDDSSNLFLGTGDKLYWPNVDNYKVNAFRAYFHLSDPTLARQFVLNFGDEVSAIGEITNSKSANGKCFDLQGRRVSTALKPGIYIIDGKKVVVPRTTEKTLAP